MNSEYQELLFDLKSVVTEINDSLSDLRSMIVTERAKKHFVFSRKRRILKNSDFDADVLALIKSVNASSFDLFSTIDRTLV